jgi:hypothetical protein
MEYLKDLMEIEYVESELYDSWTKKRLHILLCDYLAREGDCILSVRVQKIGL